MALSAFRDPKVRRAYIGTKVAVFCAAALITWPLSMAIGPQAWLGLGIFALVLLALGFAMLGTGGVDTEEETSEENDDEPPEIESAVEIPIEDFIDLHPFPPGDVPNVVSDYVEAAHAEGFREVRLIHGRGIGVQRERVRSLLAKHPLVIEYSDATSDRGGWGATVATLQDG